MEDTKAEQPAQEQPAEKGEEASPKQKKKKKKEHKEEAPKEQNKEEKKDKPHKEKEKKAPKEHKEEKKKKEVKKPDRSDWIVFINPKSGGQQGAAVLRDFDGVLSPDQIFNLFEGGPRPGLERWLKNPEYNVVVCGGDGSVGWVLGVAFDMKLKKQPKVGVVPLGTGNDLARVFGWGGANPSDSPATLLNKLTKSKVLKIDRWQITCVPTGEQHHEKDKKEKKKKKDKNEGEGEKEEKKEEKEQSEHRTFIINNYFSLGTDAEIALSFHHMREKHTNLFSNQVLNKGWYGALGAKAVATRHGPLNKWITVELDGKELDVPNKVRGLIVLNVPSYAGGTNPWGTQKSKTFLKPSIADGQFEVFGVKGAAHLARIQSKVSHGIRLGQGKSMKITTTREIPAQVDGEPWLLVPSQVTVEFQSRAKLLYNMGNKDSEKYEKFLLGGKHRDDDDDEEEEEGGDDDTSGGEEEDDEPKDHDHGKGKEKEPVEDKHKDAQPHEEEEGAGKDKDKDSTPHEPKEHDVPAKHPEARED